VPIVVALLILLAGVGAGVPGVAAFGVVAVGVALARATWFRTGSGVVTYRRRLATDRAVCGDEIGLDIAVHNRGALPLPWVRTVDWLGRGVAVRRRAQPDADAAHDELVNGWTLGPFETVVRHFAIATHRRGVYELGPLTTSAGDLLGRPMPLHEDEGRDRYLVRPRMVVVHGLADSRDWEGDRLARHGLTEDPSRYAGIRPYHLGDPLRRVHWRASARAGTMLTRRFDPSRRRDVLLALDLRVPRGPGIGAAERDASTEGLVVVAMSIARLLHVEGAAVGLAVAGFGVGTGRHLLLPPNSTEAGLALIADMLARLDAVPSMAFPSLLGEVGRRLAPGTTIATIGAVDPVESLAARRRLRHAGFGVIHLAYGEEAAAFATRARAVGVPARIARLDGTWATSNRLELVG
jgi:uncharacterized protein (DUF58 family)